ncbi:MAG: hypothetical protein LBI87_15450, partial [Candidatus Accumulibacter sp.]|nr:hypothetical protein [Accumulibacter sp.]
TAYSRREKRVIAFVTGTGLEAAKSIYRKVKALRSHISHISNSCHDVAFSCMGLPEPRTMTQSQTHLIESSNSSIRDNLARFNRRSKRFSKTLNRLKITLDLFINRSVVIDNAMGTFP